jgi:MoaA/NifB/PqqE/SkfB family radical SAM enzyme
MEIRDDIKFYGKLAQRKAGYVAGQVELTSDCFQFCTACDSWKSHARGQIRGVLSLNDVVKLCDELGRMKTFEHLTFTGGDPQKWPAFEEFFEYHRILYPFTFQVNTALARGANPVLWQKMIDRVRVSLDAVLPDTYRKARGVKTDPEEILARMEALRHPNLATMTCVSDVNIDEVPAIIARLNAMSWKPRKAMFLAVMEHDVAPGFWQKFSELKTLESPFVPTSFSEDVAWVREFTRSPEADKIPCYSGSATFHIKCNGEVYPCCLIGGEAIKTRREMAIGNILTETMEGILRRYQPKCHYADKSSPCVAVCQYKQLQMNRAGHAASLTTLSMP